jgi:hypothetical protein
MTSLYPYPPKPGKKQAFTFVKVTGLSNPSRRVNISKKGNGNWQDQGAAKLHGNGDNYVGSVK